MNESRFSIGSALSSSQEILGSHILFVRNNNVALFWKKGHIRNTRNCRACMLSRDPH